VLVSDTPVDIQQQALPVPYRHSSVKSPYRWFIQRFGKRKRESEPARHARRAYKNLNSAWFSSAVLVFVLLFLFLPLVIIAVFSFNEGKAIVWSGFSLKWYAALFLESEKLWASFRHSIFIAFVSAFCSVVIGTFAGLGVQWYRFRGRGYVQAVSILPMVLPEVVIGMSTLIFFSAINIPLGFLSIIIAHITFCLPFVFLLVLARLEEFDFSIVEAAHDLGAKAQLCGACREVVRSVPGIAYRLHSSFRKRQSRHDRNRFRHGKRDGGNRFEQSG